MGGSPEPDNSEKTGQKLLVEDLILTDSFLVKGKIEGKFSRLSMVISNWTRRFLVVSSAQMVDLKNGDVIRTSRVHINMDELILLHEYVDASGDFYLKSLSEAEKNIQVRAFVNGPVSLEIAGQIQEGAYDPGPNESSFFVMESCQVKGLDSSVSREFSSLAHLAYAILNSRKIAYLYDFS